MKRKTTIAVITSLILTLMLPTFVTASNGSIVYVTISDENGKTVLAMEEVTVADLDGDGVMTIDEVLNSAHEQFYEGGAAVGYGCEETEYGISLTKLWGCENGSSYGYYVNDVSAMSLSDYVEAGDRVNAFVYTDTETYSDVYTYFDVTTVSIEEGESVDLTLKSAGYDENWAPIAIPCADAEILINGTASGIKTDADGKASVICDAAGTYVISARSDSAALVPPVCIVKVKPAENETTTETPKTAEETAGKTTASPAATLVSSNASAQTGDFSFIVITVLISSAIMALIVIMSKYAKN